MKKSMNLLSVSAFFKTFQPLRVQSILFSLKILPLNKENDHRLKKLLIVEKITLVTTLGNLWISVWRIWILTLGSKGFKNQISTVSIKLCFFKWMFSNEVVMELCGLQFWSASY